MAANEVCRKLGKKVSAALLDDAGSDANRRACDALAHESDRQRAEENIVVVGCVFESAEKKVD